MTTVVLHDAARGPGLTQIIDDWGPMPRGVIGGDDMAGYRLERVSAGKLEIIVLVESRDRRRLVAFGLTIPGLDERSPRSVHDYRDAHSGEVEVLEQVLATVRREP